MYKHCFALVVVVALTALTGCQQLLNFGPDFGAEVEDQNLTLTRRSFENISTWENENHHRAITAMKLSCQRIMKQEPTRLFHYKEIAGTYANWQPPCKHLLADPQLEQDPAAARAFFEQWFVPYKATTGIFEHGLFTGYYEPILRGSRTKTERYKYPLYKRPSDLIDINLGQFRSELDGQRLAGRVVGNRLRPYESRAEIEQFGLKEKDRILVYVDNPIDAFFLHIQGSGRIDLAEGGIMRVGYAGQNGHPYYAIGRELVKKGELEKEQVSLQSIRAWMKSHPDKAVKLRHTNPSFIFFRELGTNQPIGGEGVPLTPHRSIAIDTRYIPYGTPIWLRAKHPIYPEKTFDQLLIAQDTGGAIRGPIRGDFFWGSGQEAELLAGQMKSRGQYWLLLPKSINVRQLSTEKGVTLRH